MAKEKAVKAGLSFADKVKKGAKAAKKAASDVERGVATRVGKKEGVEIAKGAKTKNLGAGFGLTQKGKGARMATKAQRDDVVKSGRRRLGAGAVGAAGAATILSGDGKDKKEKKYNVGVSKGGVPFKEAFKHYRGKGNKTFTWNGKKYTTDLKSEVKPKAKVEKEKPKKERKRFRPFGGAIRRALLGKDEKFGGDKGAIDFIRRKKKEDKKKPTSPASGASRRPGGKAMGGMMKSKMASKGGAKGGKKMAPGMMGGGMAGKDRIGNMLRSRMANDKRAAALAKGDKQIAMRQRAPGMKKGGTAGKFPDLTGDGKVTQKDILKGRGVPGFSEGGGAKKSKGYSKGGVARKGKPRGVGVALRGYGKALK